jgi:hypothetical protein
MAIAPPVMIVVVRAARGCGRLRLVLAALRAAALALHRLRFRGGWYDGSISAIARRGLLIVRCDCLGLRLGLGRLQPEFCDRLERNGRGVWLEFALVLFASGA